MKKTTLITAILMLGLTASADVGTDMWNYAIGGLNSSANFSLPVAVGDLTPYLDQAAATWTVTMMDGASVLGVAPLAAILGGTFYINAWNTPSILEGTVANYLITSSDGFATLSSADFTLPEAEDPLGATDLHVLNTSFNFSDSSWEVVPEPATALLFGIGGIGAFIIRRNKKKTLEEADA